MLCILKCSVLGDPGVILGGSEMWPLSRKTVWSFGCRALKNAITNKVSLFLPFVSSFIIQLPNSIHRALIIYTSTHVQSYIYIKQKTLFPFVCVLCNLYTYYIQYIILVYKCIILIYNDSFFLWGNSQNEIQSLCFVCFKKISN